MPNFKITPPPVVIAALSKSWDGVWLATVKCPFCSKTHTHGGGDIAYPPQFGVRLTHCVDRSENVYDVQGEPVE
jgi:hypothetical protein